MSDLRVLTGACAECGKPESDSKHIRYGGDLENPVKHEFRAACGIRREAMSEDLRALTEHILRDRRSWPEAEELARAVLTLLSSLEAREVELRMLRESNTVLNERLEAAEIAKDALKVAVELLKTMPKKRDGEEVAREWLARRKEFLEGREEKP